MSPAGLPPSEPLSYRGLDPTGLGRPQGTPDGAGTIGAGSRPLLEVCDLSVSFATREGEVRAVDGVSFALGRGEILAIVGESGSGKSVCAMTLMGLTRGPNATIAGRAMFDGRELIGMSEQQLRRVRGAELAMVFQDPQSSLNPVYRVGDQIAEQIRAHEPFVSKESALRRAEELMERARIPNARERVRAYPHELSGGMRQRVMIAMALSLGAKVLLADEPTTALDVTVQARILAELKDLREEEDLSIVLITHDFGVVADVADRIAVMQAGRIVEQGRPAEIFEGASHPYTRGLLEALQPIAKASPTRTRGAPLLEVEDLRVQYPGRGRRGAGIAALDGVSLSLAAGETLAIVGESGCGKTTLLRSVARLIEPTGGAIRLGGQDLARASRRELAMARRDLGMVFQDPQASLNPRRRVGGTLEHALRASGLDRAEARSRVGETIERVGLNPAQAARFPHELSGGERQRVGIARALAGKPRLVLLDEPVSSLDASLRRGAIDLLMELQAELDCAYVLVSHDFTTVEAVADRIAVMQGGKVVELADARELLAHPTHPYTQELLAACPRIPGLPGGVASEAWPDSEKSREEGGSALSRSPLGAEDRGPGAEISPPRSPSSSKV